MPPKDSEDLCRDMERVRRKAAALADISILADHGRTSRSGSDPTGAVTFNLAPDGTPMLIELAQGWRSRLRGGPLGAAVITALRSARQAKTTTLLAAVEGLPASLSDLATARAAAGHDHRRTRADSADVKSVAIAEVIGALEAAMRPPSVPPDGFTVTDQDVTPERPVVFGVGPGGVVESCVIEPRWERFYPADQVATRLNEALHRDLARGR